MIPYAVWIKKSSIFEKIAGCCFLSHVWTLILAIKYIFWRKYRFFISKKAYAQNWHDKGKLVQIFDTRGKWKKGLIAKKILFLWKKCIFSELHSMRVCVPWKDITLAEGSHLRTVSSYFFLSLDVFWAPKKFVRIESVPLKQTLTWKSVQKMFFLSREKMTCPHKIFVDERKGFYQSVFFSNAPCCQKGERMGSQKHLEVSVKVISNENFH